MARRLHAGGDSPVPDIGDALSNIEMLREHSTHYDLSMQGSQIPKERDIHLGGLDSTPMNNEQIDTLTQIDPEIAGMLAIMPAEQRQLIKEMLVKVMEPPQEPEPQIVVEVPAVEVSARDEGEKAYNMNELRQIAKACGINSFGKSKVFLIDALKRRGEI